jgi:hypothetical protein
MGPSDGVQLGPTDHGGDDWSKENSGPLRLVVPAVPEIVPHVRHQVRRHLQRFGIDGTGTVEVLLPKPLATPSCTPTATIPEKERSRC